MSPIGLGGGRVVGRTVRGCCHLAQPHDADADLQGMLQASPAAGSGSRRAAVGVWRRRCDHEHAVRPCRWTATLLLPAPRSARCCPLIGRMRTSLFAGAGCWARAGSSATTARPRDRERARTDRESLVPTCDLCVIGRCSCCTLLPAVHALFLSVPLVLGIDGGSTPPADFGRQPGTSRRMSFRNGFSPGWKCGTTPFGQVARTTERARVRRHQRVDGQPVLASCESSARRGTVGS